MKMKKLNVLKHLSFIIIAVTMFSCSKSPSCEIKKTSDLDIDSKNATIDLDLDGVDDITFTFDSYYSSTANGANFKVEGTEEWAIAVTSKFDTIVIDTTGMLDTLNEISTLRYDVSSYRPDIHPSWDQIRTITFPEIISEIDSINCQSLDFKNEVYVFRSHISHSPFGFHDRNTTGIRNFDGYMIVNDGANCYYLRVIYRDDKFTLTSIFSECI